MQELLDSGNAAKARRLHLLGARRHDLHDDEVGVSVGRTDGSKSWCCFLRDGAARSSR
jgi:hypothetical protein